MQDLTEIREKVKNLLTGVSQPVSTANLVDQITTYYAAPSRQPLFAMLGKLAAMQPTWIEKHAETATHGFNAGKMINRVYWHGRNLADPPVMRPPSRQAEGAAGEASSLVARLASLENVVANMDGQRRDLEDQVRQLAASLERLNSRYDDDRFQF